MKPLTRPELDQLEQVIDSHSMADVLDALEIIANEKAEHIETNWQDRCLAKTWRSFAKWIDGLGSKARRFGL